MANVDEGVVLDHAFLTGPYGTEAREKNAAWLHAYVQIMLAIVVLSQKR